MEIAHIFNHLVGALKLNLTTIAKTDLYSNAIILFISGKQRVMTPFDTLNFHKVCRDFHETTLSFDEIEKIYNQVSFSHTGFATLVANVSGGQLSVDDVIEFMQNETRLTAKEAVRLGLAHGIVTP